MDIYEIGIISALLILVVVLISYYAKSKNRFSKVLFGICSGVAFLFPAKLILVYLGYQISINIITIAISVILGIPGVAIIIAISLL